MPDFVPSGDAPERRRASAGARYAQPDADDATPDAESATSANRLVDRVELEELREMLREQQRATLRAVQTSADLQTKLSTARAEVEKIGKQAGSASARSTAEIENLHSQWDKTTYELNQQKQERKAEAGRAAAMLSSFREELSAAGRPGTFDGTIRRYRTEHGKAWRAVIAVTATAAIMGSSAMIWRASQAPAQVMAVAQSPDAVMAIVPATPNSVSGPPSEAAAAFTRALSQLDYALASFPGRQPEDVLREASGRTHSCMLQWNDGRPSLIFGGGSALSNSLSTIIAQCADAVRHLH